MKTQCLLLLAAAASMMIATAADPFTLESTGDGAWSEAQSWQPTRTPKTGDKVRVRAGHRIVYDVSSDALIPLLHVEGALVFARDRDTELNVAVLKVGGKMASQSGVADVHDHKMAPISARLEVGTPDDPIPVGVTARIRLHYIDGLDKDEAPLLTCRPGGRMDFHGAPMSRTWLDLGADTKPGDTEVTLSSAVEGWRVGDDIIVTGDERDGVSDEHFTTEERRIKKINGKVIALDRPLKNAHAGAGEKYRCEVANLSRNVIVESADPDGVRGHTMHHRHSAGSISYARFAHLGKKDTLGRYPIHFHLCDDSLRGESVVGVAIIDSHNRWVTIHNTHYMVVRDCIGYGSVGHGYFLEDGTEVYNVLDRNLGVQARDGKRLPEQALPFDPNDGGAFWWANGRNTFTRNTACENFRYGFRYDSQKRSNFDSTLNIRQPDGEAVATDIRTLPIYRFEDNESHTEGLYSFAFAGTDGVGPDRKHPHRLRGNTAWRTHYAMRMQLPTMLVENTDIERAVYGIYRPRFDHHVYKNLRISQTDTEPFNRGLDDRSQQHGSVSVDGLTFTGLRRSGIPFIQLSDYNVNGEAETHVRNLKIEDRRDGDDDAHRRALVDMGGGARTKDPVVAGVPVVIHDLFGSGKHAKFVSSRDARYLKSKDSYREQRPYTGEESRVTDAPDAEFPKLLDPTDDQPPATVITWPKNGQTVELDGIGGLVVRGTSTDDYGVAQVIVNGWEAEDIDYNFTRWSVRLEDVKPGLLTIKTHTLDTSGNIELTPHVIKVQAILKK
ncbi:MAG: hypothetical protein ACI9UA_002842 [Pseudoalteromonas tetraodonis]|jgi:hypothetical protein